MAACGWGGPDAGRGQKDIALVHNWKPFPRGCLQIRLLSDSFVKRPFLLRSSTVRVHSLRKKGRFPRSRLKIRYLETAPRGNNFQAQPGQCRRCLSVSRSNTLSKPFFAPAGRGQAALPQLPPRAGISLSRGRLTATMPAIMRKPAPKLW